jgi:hypothetical protein
MDDLLMYKPTYPTEKEKLRSDIQPAKQIDKSISATL